MWLMPTVDTSVSLKTFLKLTPNLTLTQCHLITKAVVNAVNEVHIQGLAVGSLEPQAVRLILGTDPLQPLVGGFK